MGLRAGAIGGCGGCPGTFESIATSTAQFIDLARRLVLAGGDLLDGLAQRCKAQCYLLSPGRVVEGGRLRGDRIRQLRRFRRRRPNGSVFETGRRLRSPKLLDPARELRLRRPTKFRGRCRGCLLGRLAVGQPGQGSSDANADRDQVTSEQNSPFRLPFWRAFRLAVCCQEALIIFAGGMFV